MSKLIRQSAFHGEVSPAMYGHSESEAYKFGLRLCRNWIITKTGQPTRRPGLEYISTIKYPAQNAVLIPFVFSNEDAYVLEFGQQYVRFYSRVNGAHAVTRTSTPAAVVWDGGTTFSLNDLVSFDAVDYVSLSDGNLNNQPTVRPDLWAVIDLSIGAVYEIGTPYQYGDTVDIKFAQVGDVITLVHPSYAPLELRFVAEEDWRVTTVAFAQSATFRPSGLSDPKGEAGTNGVPWTNITNYLGGEYVIDAANFLSYLALQPSGPGTAAGAKRPSTPNPGFWAQSLDPAHVLKNIQYQVSAVYRDALGRVQETAPSDIALFVMCCTSDRPFTLGWLAPPDPGGFFSILYYKVFKGHDGILGLISTVPAGTLTFKDEGFEPNYTHRPLQGTNPFAYKNDHDGTTTFYYPTTVAFHEGRRVFGGSLLKPDTLLGSSLDYPNVYDQYIPVRADNAYEWKVQSSLLEKIRSIVPLRSLLVLTNSGEWEVRGDAYGAPISAVSVDAKRHSGWGASTVQPLVLGNEVLFESPLGGMIRNLMYDARFGTYVGVDLSAHAAHLLENGNLIQWGYQRTDRVAWLALTNLVPLRTTLLSVTYDRDLGVNAWARHETGVRDNLLGDTVESVCVAPTGALSDTFVIVNRWVAGPQGLSVSTRTVEQLAPLGLGLVTLPIIDPTTGGFRTPAVQQNLYHFLDCSKTVDGSSDGVVTAALSGGATWLAGDQMTLTLSGLPAGFTGFTAADAGTNAVVLDPDGAYLRLRVIAVTSNLIATVEADSDIPTFYQTRATTAWAYARTVFTHPVLRNVPLESGLPNGSRGLTALVDGDALGPVHALSEGILPSWDAATGTLTLATPAVVCTFGLSYNSDIELLDLAEQPEQRGHFKRVLRVIFEVAQSRGLWAGEDFDSLSEWEQRAVADGDPLLPTTDLNDIYITGDWNRRGRAVLRAFDPLPCTLLAVTREVEFGGT